MHLTSKIIEEFNAVEKNNMKVQKLIQMCKLARKRGYFTRNEFLAICRWKSPRPMKHYTTNSEEEIKQITKKAFSTLFEKRKIELLDKLKGVNVPMASALLTIMYPECYGVIDVKAWYSLVQLGIIRGKNAKKKRSFNVNDWYRYMKI